MDDGIALTDVAQELVTKTLALAGAFYQSGYIDYLNGGGNDSARMNQLGQFGQALIGNGDGSYVGFNGTEREVCCTLKNRIDDSKRHTQKWCHFM